MLLIRKHKYERKFLKKRVVDMEIQGRQLKKLVKRVLQKKI